MRSARFKQNVFHVGRFLVLVAFVCPVLMLVPGCQPYVIAEPAYPPVDWATEASPLIVSGRIEQVAPESRPEKPGSSLRMDVATLRISDVLKNRTAHSE